jgi:hypothetical protein
MVPGEAWRKILSGTRTLWGWPTNVRQPEPLVKV